MLKVTDIPLGSPELRGLSSPGPVWRGCRGDAQHVMEAMVALQMMFPKVRCLCRQGGADSPLSPGGSLGRDCASQTGLHRSQGCVSSIRKGIPKDKNPLSLGLSPSKTTSPRNLEEAPFSPL